LIERTAQLIQEARDLELSRYSLHRNTDDLVVGSKLRLAKSRELLKKPVYRPFRDGVPLLNARPAGPGIGLERRATVKKRAVALDP
jgi:hypothetical protein